MVWFHHMWVHRTIYDHHSDKTGGNQMLNTVQAIWRITCCLQLQMFFLQHVFLVFIALLPRIKKKKYGIPT